MWIPYIVFLIKHISHPQEREEIDPIFCPEAHLDGMLWRAERKPENLESLSWMEHLASTGASGDVRRAASLWNEGLAARAEAFCRLGSVAAAARAAGGRRGHGCYAVSAVLSYDATWETQTSPPEWGPLQMITHHVGEALSWQHWVWISLGRVYETVVFIEVKCRRSDHSSDVFRSCLTMWAWTTSSGL